MAVNPPTIVNVRIKPERPFMVPFMPITTNEMEILPKIPTRTLGNDVIQGNNHCRNYELNSSRVWIAPTATKPRSDKAGL